MAECLSLMLAKMLILGIGGAVNLNDQCAVRGEWEFVDLDDVETSRLSVGVQFNV